MPVKIKVGVKKLKYGPKSEREIVFLPVKKLKKGPKMAFTGTFFFTGKNTGLSPAGCRRPRPSSCTYENSKKTSLNII